MRNLGVLRQCFLTPPPPYAKSNLLFLQVCPMPGWLNGQIKEAEPLTECPPIAMVHYKSKIIFKMLNFVSSNVEVSCLGGYPAQFYNISCGYVSTEVSTLAK